MHLLGCRPFSHLAAKIPQVDGKIGFPEFHLLHKDKEIFLVARAAPPQQVRIRIHTHPQSNFSRVLGRERLDQQLRELTSRLVAQHSELAEVTATLEKMRNAMDSSGPMTAANLISSDEAFEYRAELGELNRRKAAAISNFGEDSPQVLSIERSINSVEEGP